MPFLDNITALGWAALTILGGVVLSVAGNLLMPRVRAFLSRFSAAARLRQRLALTVELDRVRSFHDNLSALAIESQVALFGILSYLALGLATSAVFAFVPIGGGAGFAGVAAPCFFISFGRAYRHLRLVRRCRVFPVYEKFTQDEIRRLS